MFSLLNIIFSKKNNLKNFVYYYSIFFLLLGWILSIFLSFFIANTANISNPFVIFSILIKILVIFIAIYFIKLLFIDKNQSKKVYEFFKIFTGYGIVVSYVFFSFPRIVGEFYKNISLNYSVLNYITVLLITLFPSLLFVIISTDNSKLIFNFFTQDELEYEKKVKKDKKLKKKEHEKIKKSRGFFANLWYEWIDVILQAVIIAMLIQQFLFQLYVIPSESMVPTFLVKDRVIVNKLIYGPRLPLTDWKLPSFVKPKVGDIVVFLNPKTDDEKSELRYNSVFARVFHPFIYMLTLSLVDIDRKKSDGSPKERFLVKRVIAKEGEKICIVNDRVYKRKKGSKEWIPMEKSEKEYGQFELYYKNISRLQTQVMPEIIRKLYLEADELINKYEISFLKEELKKEKSIFLNKISMISDSYINKIFSDFNDNRFQEYKSMESFISRSLLNKITFLSFYRNPLFVHSEFKYGSDDIKKLEKEVENLIEQYYFCIFLNTFEKLILFFKNEKIDFNYLNKNIYSEININENDSPYDITMKKVNALYKIFQFKLFSKILELYFNNSFYRFLDKIELLLKSDFYSVLKNYFLLNIYLYDIPCNENRDSKFSLRNFKDFPENEDEFIPYNEFFVMGDNRYNSLDSRFDSENEEIDTIYLDPNDKGIFSTKVKVRWKPHTISMKYILGKAKFIYWPIDRITYFK